MPRRTRRTRRTRQGRVRTTTATKAEAMRLLTMFVVVTALPLYVGLAVRPAVDAHTRRMKEPIRCP